MISDKGKAFWLGVFVLIAVGTVAWLLLFLKPHVGDGKTVLKMRFTNIEGVTIGTRVNLGGKPVGAVVAIQEVDDARSTPPDAFGHYYFYEVTAKVDSKVEIYNYDLISLSTQGLLGEKMIEITPYAPPAGGAPAHLVTHEILYGRGGDQLQMAIEDFSHLLSKVSSLIDQERPRITDSLCSITEAAKEVYRLANRVLSLDLPQHIVQAADAICVTMHKADDILHSIESQQLPERFAAAAHSFEEVGRKLSHGEGTIPRLLNSDCVYFQVTSTLGKLEGLLSDISNYGLLFQYDKRWQRQHTTKMKRMEQLCTAQDFQAYVQREMHAISCNLDRIERAAQQADICCPSYQELMSRLENLRETLQNYNDGKGPCK